jgi:hypothetical protein
MSDYVESSISKEEQTNTTVSDVLISSDSTKLELIHGGWIKRARSKLKMRRVRTPLFALLLVFMVLFAGSVFLFENMDILTGPMYAAKISISSLFAVSLGFIMSIWWSTAARFDEKIKEAERLDREYRDLLMRFSDSLFDIINALNTLATNPPKPFIVATEFLLGEYIHTLQSQLQRYGDYVAGLGFDATDFLDEKIRIFDGIRERASVSIQGMPRELESLFINRMNLDKDKSTTSAATHQQELREKLKELVSDHKDDISAEKQEPPAD